EDLPVNYMGSECVVLDMGIGHPACSPRISRRVTASASRVGRDMAHVTGIFDLFALRMKI
ncbi:hypothetical protein, partial [Streptomyces sudanensis]